MPSADGQVRLLTGSGDPGQGCMGKQELPLVLLDRSCEEGCVGGQAVWGGTSQKGWKVGFHINCSGVLQNEIPGPQWVSPLGQPVLSGRAGLRRH